MQSQINIQKVAVIGSGVMGAQIAAHLANAQINVLLFDVAQADNSERSYLAKSAIEKLLNNPLKPLMSKSYVKFIHPANLEDDINQLLEVDWVIEAIIEKKEIKKSLYQQIIPFLKPNCIISSNTSTIPLNDLTVDLPSINQQHFIITHFFNPVRYLPLLEIVTTQKVKPEIYEVITNFCKTNLGKVIIQCKDTPGFIANRLGCFWLELALRKAIKYNISPPLADFVLYKYCGIPKTGIFKLWDLIGIDLMPLISNSIIQNLDKNDKYKILIEKEPLPLIDQMIDQKLLGNKNKQGFYKKEKLNGKTQEFVLNYNNLQYEPLNLADTPKFSSFKELINYPGNIGNFVGELMSETLAYATELYPAAAHSINDIDIAMKTGYGWKYGPFELIDKLSDDQANGVEILKLKLQLENIQISETLNSVGNNKFYQDDKFWHKNKYQQFDNPLINPFKILKKANPITSNNSAAIWDLGDQIIGLEFTKKLHVLDYNCFEMMDEAISQLESRYKGLIIFSDDENFCAGADLNNLLVLITAQEYNTIRKLIDFGQKINLKLKYAKKPIISAVNGVALGGGCEILLHSHQVVAHADSKIGLVESNIGLIPGWGGCKEIILRSFYDPTIIDSFETLYNGYKLILDAQQSSSAIEAKELGLLDKQAHIIMNHHDLLDYSKKLILNDNNFNNNNKIKLNTIYIDQKKIIEFKNKLLNQENPEKNYIASQLMNLFVANNQNVIKEEHLLKLEQDSFINLCQQPNAKVLISNIINKS